MKRVNNSSTSPTSGVAKRAASEIFPDPPEAETCTDHEITNPESGLVSIPSPLDIVSAADLGGRSDGESLKKVTKKEDDDGIPETTMNEPSSEICITFKSGDNCNSVVGNNGIPGVNNDEEVSGVIWNSEVEDGSMPEDNIDEEGSGDIWNSEVEDGSIPEDNNGEEGSGDIWNSEVKDGNMPEDSSDEEGSGDIWNLEVKDGSMPEDNSDEEGSDNGGSDGEEGWGDEGGVAFHHVPVAHEAPPAITSNWEGPSRYLPDLARLRQRQSEEDNLQPLSQLSLRCVSRNWKYFSERNEPFAGLPGSVLEGLVRFLEAEDKLDSPTVLPLVVTARSRYISVNCLRAPRFQGDQSSVFFTEDFSNIFRKISTTCKENMQKLRLRVDHVGYLQVARDPYPSLDDLNETLVRMTNLTELCLHCGSITDQTVALLAKHCRQLRVLDLDDNPSVTNSAMDHLCGTDEVPQSGCKILQHLSINDTAVTYQGVKTVLEHLPQLTQLKHESTSSAIILMANNTQTQHIKLKLEEYTSHEGHHNEIQTVCTILEDMKSFVFTNDRENFDYITSKEISPNNAYLNILYVLSRYGAQLTKVDLKVAANMEFDVSNIAHYCPNLEVFSFQSLQHWDHDDHPVLPCHFQKLREVNLSLNRFSRAFSETALERMLSSPVLEKIQAKNYLFPNHILVSLIEEAKVHEVVFSKLTHISITSCDLNFERVKEIVCVAPNLKDITTFSCRNVSSMWMSLGDSVGHFISRNRLGHVKLTWH